MSDKNVKGAQSFDGYIENLINAGHPRLIKDAVRNGQELTARHLGHAIDKAVHSLGVLQGGTVRPLTRVRVVTAVAKGLMETSPEIVDRAIEQLARGNRMNRDNIMGALRRARTRALTQK